MNCLSCTYPAYAKKLCRYHYYSANPLRRSPIKRKAVKIRKVAKSESLGRLIQQAVKVFHKWIKLRDSEDGRYKCISCPRTGDSREAHAGHYLPAGNNSAVRLDPDDVHLQCPWCNIVKHGNQAEYRIGLIHKIGEERVLALEEKAKFPYKWDRAELLEIIETYKLKVRLKQVV